MALNLNNSFIEGRAYPEPFGPTMQDFSAHVEQSSLGGGVEVCFRDLEQRIVSEINKSFAVAGCVAWLTNPAILEALAKKEHSLIVVQKEDFLRPDTHTKTPIPEVHPPLATRDVWRKALQEQYALLQGGHRSLWGDLISSLSLRGDPNGSVRCSGCASVPGGTSMPRMHNKFLVFFYEKPTLASIELPHIQGEWSKADVYRRGMTIGGARWFEAIAEGDAGIWTGSFNMSQASTNSLENALLIRSKAVAQPYFREFEQVFALSEPLNWTSTWTTPEYQVAE